MLERAVRFDENADLCDVNRKLVNGEYDATLLVFGESKGVVVSQIGDFGGVKCLWLPYLAGGHKGGPRKFLTIVREAMAFFETIGRNADCEEIRIGGRYWGRVFPDFEPFDDTKNRLRKKL